MEASQKASEAHQNLSYPAQGLSKPERSVALAEYRKGEQAIRDQFEKDIAEDYLYGVYSDAQKSAIFEFAWQAGGKSFNDTEVHYSETAELLNTLNKLTSK